jgi:hypothetical protein
VAHATWPSAYEHLGDPVEVGVLVVLVDGYGRDPGGPVHVDGLPQGGVLRQSGACALPAHAEDVEVVAASGGEPGARLRREPTTSST